MVDVYDFFGMDVNICNVNKVRGYKKVKVKTTGWALKQWIGGHLEFIKNVKVKDKSFAKEMNDIVWSSSNGRTVRFTIDYQWWFTDTQEPLRAFIVNLHFTAITK